MLSFHLGLHPARRPHSRATVARRFDTSRRRVARSQNRAVARLRSADRRGDCGGGGFVVSATFHGGSGELMSTAAFSPSESAGGGSEDDRGGVAGVDESGGDARGGDRKPAPIPGAGLVNDVGDDLRDLAAIVGGLLALALALALFALYRKGALERPSWLRRSGD